MSGIYAAMNAVMEKVQSIGKKQRNTDQGFNFRGVDAVVNSVGPVLREHGVIVVPHQVLDVVHERYETRNKAVMDGVTVRIVWRFYAQDGSFIEAASAGQAADAGDKAVSKAHSVAYRTVLLQALCIPTDEPDPDSSVHERGGAAVAPRPPSIGEVRGRIKEHGDRLGWSKQDIEGDYEARCGGTFMGASVDDLIAYALVLADIPSQPTLAGA